MPLPPLGFEDFQVKATLDGEWLRMRVSCRPMYWPALWDEGERYDLWRLSDGEVRVVYQLPKLPLRPAEHATLLASGSYAAMRAAERLLR